MDSSSTSKESRPTTNNITPQHKSRQQFCESVDKAATVEHGDGLSSQLLANLPRHYNTPSIASSTKATKANSHSDEPDNTPCSSDVAAPRCDLDVVLENNDELVASLAKLCIKRAANPDSVTALELENFKLSLSKFRDIIYLLKNVFGNIYPASGSGFASLLSTDSKASQPEGTTADLEIQKPFREFMSMKNQKKLICKIKFVLDNAAISPSLEKAMTEDNFMRNVTIHCVRHAQAEHNDINRGIVRWSLRDPKLTVIGEIQTERLAKLFPHTSKITHVLCSPQLRTLQTALGAFAPLLSDGQPKMILWPDLRECGCGPTAKGMTPAQLKKFEGVNYLDLSLMYNNWDADENYRIQSQARADAVQKDLVALVKAIRGKGNWKGVEVGLIGKPEDEEIHILLISHGGFLKTLLTSLETNSNDTTTAVFKTEPEQSPKAGFQKFYNAEFRSFHLMDVSGKLIETKESVESRVEQILNRFEGLTAADS